MASQTIPNLPAAISLNGTEQLWAVQSNADVRVTIAQIAAFFGGQQGFNAFMAAYLASLPTTLPATSGQPWLNGGAFCIS